VPPKQDAKDQSGELSTSSAWLHLSEDTEQLDFSDLGSDIQLKIIIGDYYAKNKIVFYSKNPLFVCVKFGVTNLPIYAWDGGGNL
jgi:hypothetical protein